MTRLVGRTIGSTIDCLPLICVRLETGPIRGCRRRRPCRQLVDRGESVAQSLVICCLKLGFVTPCAYNIPPQMLVLRCFAIGCREIVDFHLVPSLSSLVSSRERKARVIFVLPRNEGRLSLNVSKWGPKPLL
ncbi:unnamed protein product [Ectocarpus sp. 4 AP-2014]